MEMFSLQSTMKEDGSIRLNLSYFDFLGGLRMTNRGVFRNYLKVLPACLRRK